MGFFENFRRVRNSANLKANQDKLRSLKNDEDPYFSSDREKEVKRLNKKIGAAEAREKIFEQKAQMKIAKAQAPRFNSDNRQFNTDINYKKGVNDNTVAIANRSGGKGNSAAKKSSKPKKR